MNRIEDEDLRRQQLFLEKWCEELFYPYDQIMEAMDSAVSFSKVNPTEIFVMDQNLLKENQSLCNQKRHIYLKQITDQIMYEYFGKVLKRKRNVREEHEYENKKIMYEMLKKQAPYFIALVYQLPLENVLLHKGEIYTMIEILADELGVFENEIYFMLRQLSGKRRYQSLFDELECHTAEEVTKALGEDFITSLREIYRGLSEQTCIMVWRDLNIEVILKQFIMHSIQSEVGILGKEEEYQQQITSLPFVMRYHDIMLELSKKMLPMMLDMDQKFLSDVTNLLNEIKQRGHENELNKDLLQSSQDLKKQGLERIQILKPICNQLNYQDALHHIKIEANENEFEKLVMDTYPIPEESPLCCYEPYLGLMVFFIMGRSRANQKTKSVSTPILKQSVEREPEKRVVQDTCLNIEYQVMLELQKEQAEQEVIASLWEVVKSVDNLPMMESILGCDHCCFKYKVLLKHAKKEFDILNELKEQASNQEEYMMIEEELNQLMNVQRMLSMGYTKKI